MKNLLGAGEEGVIRRDHLKVAGIHKLFLILREAFIGGTRLKHGGRLLEDLLYLVSCIHITSSYKLIQSSLFSQSRL